MKRLFLLIPLILAVILSLYPDEVRARSESGIRGRAYGRTRGWRNQGWSRAPRMSGPGYRLSPSIRGPGYDKSLGYGWFLTVAKDNCCKFRHLCTLKKFLALPLAL